MNVDHDTITTVFSPHPNKHTHVNALKWDRWAKSGRW